MLLLEQPADPTNWISAWYHQNQILASSRRSTKQYYVCLLPATVPVICIFIFIWCSDANSLNSTSYVQHKYIIQIFINLWWTMVHCPSAKYVKKVYFYNLCWLWVLDYWLCKMKFKTVAALLDGVHTDFVVSVFE